MAFTDESSKQKKFSKTAAAFAALVLVLGMIPIAGMAWAWGEAEKEKALEAEDVAVLHDDQALMSTSAFVPVVDDAGVGLESGDPEGAEGAGMEADVDGQAFNAAATLSDAAGYQAQEAGAGAAPQADGPCADGTCTHQAAIGNVHYDTLKAAFNAAVNADVVTLVSDIVDMPTDAIATVDTGKTIFFDMAGHSITVAADFAGRPIVNNGMLTVTGNGTIDSSASNSGYGAIRNDGTLTVINGRYVGSVMGDGTAIRNGIGSHLTIHDGYFAGTGAVYNVGEAVIYKGEFETLACSGCKTPFAYALNNRDENGVSGTMRIVPTSDEDVKVHGTQGALASVGGASVYVSGGTFYTNPCQNNHTGSTFYALYVSGKEGMEAATCVVDGGKFSTTGANACLYLVNENPSDNGGNPGDAVVRINGGSFEQGPAKNLINFGDKPGGTLEINGGTFVGTNLDSATPYVSLASTQQLGDNSVTVAPRTADSADTVAEVDGKYYASLKDAFGVAGNGATISLLADAEWSAAEGDIVVEKALAIDLAAHVLNVTGVGANGITVQNGGSLTIRNGSIKANGVAAVNNSVISVLAGSSVALDGITSFETDGAALQPTGEGARVTVSGSAIHAPESYAIATNAGSPDNYGVVVYLMDSAFTGNTPVLLNVPGYLAMDNCTVSGQLQGVVVRGGTADIRNSTIVQSYPGDRSDAESMANYFESRDWGSGNMVNLAAITIGNKGGKAYQYPSNVSISNSTVKVEGDNNELFPCVYVYANESEGNGVSLSMTEVTFVGGTTPQVVYGNEKANVTEKVAVAKVGENYYNSLQEAIDVDPYGVPVVLVADVSVDETDRGNCISVRKRVVLDLNGHAIVKSANKRNAPMAIEVSAGGELVVKGEGTIDGKASYVSNNDGKAYSGEGIRVSAANESAPAGKLVVSDGATIKGGFAVRQFAGSSVAVDGGSLQGNKYGIYDSNGTVVVNGGEVFGLDKGIMANETSADVQVNGGTVRSVNDTAVHVQLGANLTVNDGQAVSPHMAINGLTNNKNKMGTITVNGGLVRSESYDNPKPENYGAIVANSYHVVVAEGVIEGPYAVSLSTFSGNAYAESSGVSTFDMTGGRINGSIQGIGLNNLGSAGTTAVITGGEVVSSGGTAIYWPAEGSLTIGGSAAIEGDTGIEARMGTITIEGGTISGMGEPIEGLPTGGGACVEGSALLVCSQMYDKCVTSPNLDVVITDGLFSSINGHAVTVQNMKKNEVPANVVISGGEFVANGAEALGEKVANEGKADVTTIAISGGLFSSEVAEKNCAEGFIPVFIYEGVYGVANIYSFAGTVSAYGDGKVNGNVAVFDGDATLEFVEEGNDDGRAPNKWWAGINVSVPEWVNPSNAVYQKISKWWEDDGSSSDWTESAAIQPDGQYWAMVSPEYIRQYAGDDGKLMYRYRFDWNGDGEFDQDVAIVVTSDVKFADHVHAWGEWQPISDASCTAAGSHRHACSICGEVHVEAIPALGHTWGNWATVTSPTCTTAGVSARTCVSCGVGQQRLVAALGHSWGAWTVLTPASAGVAGVERSVCAHDASHVMTRVIPALPSVSQGGSQTGNQGGNGGFVVVYQPTGGQGATTPSQNTGGSSSAPVVNETTALEPSNQAAEGEIIADDETPLASTGGTGKAKSAVSDNGNALSSGSANAAGSSQAGVMDWLPAVMGGSLLLLALAGGCFLLFFLKRKKKSQEE